MSSLLFRSLRFRTPGEGRDHLPFESVGNHVSNERGELEGVSRAASRHDETLPRRIRSNPEMLIDRIAVDADPGGSDRRCSEHRNGIGEKRPEGLGLARGDDAICRCIRMHRASHSVVCDLHDAVRVHGKAVIAGARDVRAEDGKHVGGEARRIRRREMKHGLTHGVKVTLHEREKMRRPRARGDDHEIRCDHLAGGERDPRDPRVSLDDPSNGGSWCETNPAIARLARKMRDDLPALGVAARRIEISIDEAVGIPGGKSPRNRGPIETLDNVSAATEKLVAVVLEASGCERRAPKKEEARLVKEGACAPAPPTFERAFHQRGVGLVAPVIETDDLADVRRFGERMRNRTGSKTVTS